MAELPRYEDLQQQIKALEAKLMLTEKKLDTFQLLASNTSDVIWLLDANLVFTYISPAVEKIFGKKVEDILSKSYDDIIPRKHKPFINELVRNGVNRFRLGELIHDTEPFDFQMDFLSPSRTIGMCETKANFVYSDTNVIVGISGITRDITERKQQDAKIKVQFQEIQQQNEELESINEEIVAITEELSHKNDALVDANAKIEESETKYRQLFENMYNAFVLCKVICNESGEIINYRYLEINDAYTLHTGLERKDIIGKLATDIHDPRNYDIIQKYGNVAITGVSHKVDEYIHRINRNIEGFVFRPQPNHFALIFTDVTEQRNNQKMINYLVAIIEGTDDSATIKDLNLKILNVNKAQIRNAQLTSKEELLGKTDMEAYGDTPVVRQYMEDDLNAQKLKPGEIITREEIFIRKDGQVMDTVVRKFPIFDEKGIVIGTGSISRDIGEIKKVQLQLRDFAMQLQGVIDSVKEGITLSDYAGHFEIYNRVMQEITGYTKEEVNSSVNLLDAIYPKNEQRIQAFHRIRDLIHSGGSTQIETEIVDRNGNNKILNVYTVILKYEKREYFLSVYQDITERKIAETKLLENEQRLKELNATKDKFFSIIAHDLKNPFHNVMGFCEILNRGSASFRPEKLKQIVGYIHQSAEQGFNLLQNLLDWSRSQTGRLQIYPELFDISAVVDDCLNLLAVESQKKNIELISQINSKTFVWADVNTIRTVLRNLISNAIKFTKSNGKIVVTSSKKENQIEISVIDNGIGISSQDIQKLFKIEVTHSTRGTANETGTGVGLILCKEFVEKNAGELSVESTLGQGSCFSFRLPLTSPSQNEEDLLWK